MFLDKRTFGDFSGSEPSDMSVSIPTGGNASDMDVALKYIKDAGQPSEKVDEKKLIRKIDWRIVPIMFACYTMQFIDKVLINASFFFFFFPLPSPVLEIPRPFALCFILTLSFGMRDF